MADGAASVGFSGRQGFKRVKTTIRDEVRCLITELQKDRQANYAISINKQWRVCFEWREGNAYNVEITDYH
jgi:plasmid maintenance system killer protein